MRHVWNWSFSLYSGREKDLLIQVMVIFGKCCLELLTNQDLHIYVKSKDRNGYLLVAALHCIVFFICVLQPFSLCVCMIFPFILIVESVSFSWQISDYATDCAVLSLTIRLNFILLISSMEGTQKKNKEKEIKYKWSN